MESKFTQPSLQPSTSEAVILVLLLLIFLVKELVFLALNQNLFNQD